MPIESRVRPNDQEFSCISISQTRIKIIMYDMDRTSVLKKRGNIEWPERTAIEK